jgi:nitrate reductase assembly molybdenum cofactor insertion protein NarJ
MRTVTTLQPRAGELLSQAAEWRLLGLLFEYPAGHWRSNLEALLPSLARPELSALAEAALEQFSEGLHIALFGPAGTVPVREVTYHGGVQFGYLLAELSAYYDAFGYEPLIEEAADHLAVQVGFVAFLRMKQAMAELGEDAEHAQLAADAAGAFIREHLAVQAEPVARALENFAPPFLVAASRRIFELAGPAPRSGYPLSCPLADEKGEEGRFCGPSGAGDGLTEHLPAKAGRFRCD